MVNIPINGVNEVDRSQSLPTREQRTCASTLSGRVLCYDDSGTLKQITALCSASQRPTHVFIGDAPTTVGSVSKGLFAILGADGIIEIDVADGASISVGQEVISDENGKIVAKQVHPIYFQAYMPSARRVFPDRRGKGCGNGRY